MAAATFLALLAAPMPALGQDFSCSNRAAEIQCDGAHCRVETESFTPMRLTRVGDSISLCAYSACWEGRIDFDHERSGVRFLQSLVQRNGPAHEAEASTLSIMVGRRSETAQIHWNGILSVLECGPPPAG
ncbi:hypothetical protein [Sphingosinicella sp. YJ22]|uniref:hypothetical protein n=1 Tax=Sphingosinicella sp. YJ22 TaxID=1104780 RepID=UPI00140D22D0|nr:hypothetical protein [Sphingosinicella sp. YJ22]